MENEFKTCADCDRFVSVRNCKIINPFMIKFGQFIHGHIGEKEKR